MGEEKTKKSLLEAASAMAKKSSAKMPALKSAEKKIENASEKSVLKNSAESEKTAKSVKKKENPATEAKNIKAEKKTEGKEKSSVNVKSAEKSLADGTKKISKKQGGEKNAVYDEDSILHLEGLEHIRLRPGMYIGSLGDGSNENDGIYILLKEGIDNAVDEFSQGFGDKVDIEIKDGRVKIRDYGRGIPLGKLEDCVSNVNTGAKYNNSVFKQAIGMNGVGIKATNALSSYFRAASIRDGKIAVVEFKQGVKISGSTGQAKPGSKKEHILSSFRMRNFSGNTSSTWRWWKNAFGTTHI